MEPDNKSKAQHKAYGKAFFKSTAKIRQFWPFRTPCKAEKPTICAAFSTVNRGLFFGALEGTRIPGPLIKSQMLYRLSYERILYSKTILPNNITTTRRKKQEWSGKKQHNSYPVHFARQAGPRYALPAAARSCGKFLFTNAARTVTIKSTPQGSSSPYAECNSSDDTGAAQIALVRRFFA